LYSVLITGGTPTRLNGPLVDGGDVGWFEIMPNSLGVVYLADEETDEMQELYAVFINGAMNTKLNGPLADGGDVYEFRITPDSLSVVYQADQEVDEKWELFATYDQKRVYLPLVVR
jgi:hypothetical protein